LKAPRWLTESFAQGVDEREHVAYVEEWAEPVGLCWLAQFDPAQRPCEGRFERFHFIGRQRVRNALYSALPTWESFGAENRDDVLFVAEWDCRNGGIACEAHHRRLDSHLVPLPSEQLHVPLNALPEHVLEFAADWGLEDTLEERFPKLESPIQEGVRG
jgi:hypothetical protein